MSSNVINHPRGYVIVARVTANSAKGVLPTAVELEPGQANMRETSWVLCHDLYTIRASAVDSEPIGQIPLEKLAELDAKLRFALGC